MDRHVGVLLAAQLRTLAVVVANLLGAKPGVAHKARNRRLLDAKGRHHPGVNHVVGGGDDADLLVHRHHQRVINFQQVVINDLALFRPPVVGHLALRLVQRRNKANALAFALEVVVAPLPLHAGDLDGEVGIGGVFHRHHDLGRRQRHQDHDDEGHDGPDHFDRHRFMEIGRLVANRLAVLPDRIEHDAENRHEDHGADDQHEPVQPGLILGDAGHASGQVQLIDGGTARQVADRMRCRENDGTGPGQRCPQHASQFVGNSFHRAHLFCCLG